MLNRPPLTSRTIGQLVSVSAHANSTREIITRRFHACSRSSITRASARAHVLCTRSADGCGVGSCRRLRDKYCHCSVSARHSGQVRTCCITGSNSFCSSASAAARASISRILLCSVTERFLDSLIANSPRHSAFPGYCASGGANGATWISRWKAECRALVRSPRSSFPLRIAASLLRDKRTAIRQVPFPRGSRVHSRECDRAAPVHVLPIDRAESPAIHPPKSADPNLLAESGEDGQSPDCAPPRKARR